MAQMKDRIACMGWQKGFLSHFLQLPEALRRREKEGENIIRSNNNRN
jgi:hypothetical protein